MTSKTIAVDIQELDVTKRGERIASALVSCGGTLYKTARGHRAVLVARTSFDRLKASMKFDVVDAFDGLVSIVAQEQQ